MVDRFCTNCKGYEECRLSSTARSLRRNQLSEDYIQNVVTGHEFYKECKAGNTDQISMELNDPLAISPDIIISNPDEERKLTEALRKYLKKD